MADIRVGTASWTDKTLIEAGWPPPGHNTPENPRVYHPRQFPLVEVDSSYYALPAEQTAAAWAHRSPKGFVFNIKSFSLFTHHPTKIAALPKDLRPAAEKAAKGKANVYLKDADPELTDQAWERFLSALEPLRQTGRLGAILFQFPQWFVIGRERKDYILSCADRVAPRQVCIEFRNKTWLSEDNREETLKFLADHQLPYVVVDEPQGYASSVPPVVAATAPLAVMRFHGHSDKWDSGTVQEQFRYRYSEKELNEGAPKVRELSRDAAPPHVRFNNSYSTAAQGNPHQLIGLRGDEAEHQL